MYNFILTKFKSIEFSILLPYRKFTSFCEILPEHALVLICCVSILQEGCPGATNKCPPQSAACAIPIRRGAAAVHASGQEDQRARQHRKQHVLIDKLIRYSAFSASKAMRHLIEIWDRDTITYSCDRSQKIFLVHVPIDSSTHYLAFNAIRLLYQTPTLMPACQAEKFVPFL